MGMLRTIGAVTLTTSQIIPVYTGPVLAAATFSILQGIATIVLGSTLPTNGYNGPNGYPVANSRGGNLDIHFGTSGNNNTGGSNQGSAKGQQVTLWGFATATYFNGVQVTVLDCDPTTNSFRFYFNHANVTSTSDAGSTAIAAPDNNVRVVRIECGQGNTTNLVYVGDLKLSSTRYAAALSLTGQIAFEISGQNIDPSRIFVLGTTADTVQVSLVY